MADLHGFDANEVEPVDFEPIPSGKYLGVVTESEMKPTKSGNGHYLELTFQIVEGQYKNRLLWARLNLDNPNPTAVQIARGELSAICRAVGVMAPNDSEELHDLPIVIHVKCKKRKDTDEISNEIKGFSKRESRSLTGATSTDNSTPPWKRS
jgi:hypothetical protein